MLGGLIMVAVLTILLPLTFLLTGTALAVILGQLLSKAEQSRPGQSGVEGS